MEARLEIPKSGPMLSRWSAILCGVAVALGVFLVVTSVWLVFVAGGYDFFFRNFDWFLLGTALGSAIVAGYVAGYVEDWRGAGVGVWNGLASWGLIVTAASVFVLPNFLRPLTASHTATGFLQGLDFQMMVVICCAFGGGFILAGVAASIGAAKRRPLYHITPESERRFFESLDDDRAPYAESTIGSRRDDDRAPLVTSSTTAGRRDDDRAPYVTDTESRGEDDAPIVDRTTNPPTTS